MFTGTTIGAPTDSSDLGPGAAPNEFDTGLQIQLSPRWWATADGTRHGNSGLEPIVLRPADAIEALIVQRAYHKAKLHVAWQCLREVRAAQVHGTAFGWDARILGPVPRERTQCGPAPDLEAAEERLSAICFHHDGAVKRIEADLRARGIDPDYRTVA